MTINWQANSKTASVLARATSSSSAFLAVSAIAKQSFAQFDRARLALLMAHEAAVSA
jgi:hypothetical protein